MSRPKILLYKGMAGQLLDLLKADFDITQIGTSADIASLPEETKAQSRAVAMSGADSLDSEHLSQLPAIEIVSCYGVGYDGIDATSAAERGVMVTHTPNVLNDEVANTAIGLLLATTRRIVAYDRYVREGRWEREGNAPLTRGLAGKRVGIVGMGRIGQEIAEKLAVFHCHIAYHARNRRDELEYRYFADLTEMAKQSDVLIVITPGGPATQNLIDASVMEALGPDGTLINVARGTVVDENALVAALRAGRLGAAGLDVFVKEPHVPEALLSMDNVVLLPHIGSATVETRRAMAELAVENLTSWFGKGKAVTPVPECQ